MDKRSEFINIQKQRKMKIKDFKMKVTPSQSVKVQKVIFENGGSWRDGRKEIIRYRSQYIFYKYEELTVSDYDDYSMDKELPLLTYEQFMQLYSKQPEPRKYKLIMWYPGLPDNWKHEEVVVKKKVDAECYHRQNEAKSIYFADVENNPEYWQEIEQTKFMAEDGVEINEGDVCYAVNKKTYIVVRCNFLRDLLEDQWCFISREAAQKYIQVYKPKYS